MHIGSYVELALTWISAISLIRCIHQISRSVSAHLFLPDSQAGELGSFRERDMALAVAEIIKPRPSLKMRPCVLLLRKTQ